MEVQVTQFHLPNGRQTQNTTNVDDALAGKYREMQVCGARFTAEVLSTGLVSTCIEHPDFGDFDIEITPNGPEVQRAMEKMLARFDTYKFQMWLEAVS